MLALLRTRETAGRLPWREQEKLARMLWQQSVAPHLLARMAEAVQALRMFPTIERVYLECADNPAQRIEFVRSVPPFTILQDNGSCMLERSNAKRWAADDEFLEPLNPLCYVVLHASPSTMFSLYHPFDLVKDTLLDLLHTWTSCYAGEMGLRSILWRYVDFDHYQQGEQAELALYVADRYTVAT